MAWVGGLVGVVLAAGAGTRLHPLTLLRPKALCPVANVPLVDRALEAVLPWVDDVAVNAHHRCEDLRDHLAGSGVYVSVEQPEALGTAGAIGNLKDWISRRGVLVVNSDAYRPGSLGSLLDGWDGNRLRVLAVRHTDGAGPGDFGEWRFAGASLLPWREVVRLRAEPTGLYEVLWGKAWEQGRLDVIEHDGVFIDCGTPADYLAANLHASGGDNVVGAGAVVDGEIERCVVWPNAVVRRGERLHHCVRAGTAAEPVTVEVAEA